MKTGERKKLECERFEEETQWAATNTGAKQKIEHTQSWYLHVMTWRIWWIEDSVAVDAIVVWTGILDGFCSDERKRKTSIWSNGRKNCMAIQEKRKTNSPKMRGKKHSTKKKRSLTKCNPLLLVCFYGNIRCYSFSFWFALFASFSFRSRQWKKEAIRE